MRNLKNNSPVQYFPRKVRLAGVLLCALLLSVIAPWAHAQKADKTLRKLVYKESPGYPVTLREAHIGGVVRLEIVISPKGNVDSVSPLGGNPVLVEAASAAVRKWKYAPAAAQTKEEVQINFTPD